MAMIALTIFFLLKFETTLILRQDLQRTSGFKYKPELLLHKEIEGNLPLHDTIQNQPFLLLTKPYCIQVF